MNQTPDKIIKYILINCPETLQFNYSSEHSINTNMIHMNVRIKDWGEGGIQLVVVTPLEKYPLSTTPIRWTKSDTIPMFNVR